ncbi:MAG: DUF5777 family beta-barrel protein [Bacteroidales bacterium]
MKKRLTNIVTLIAIAAFMSSCVSMSSLQTARVTEPGEFGVGLSAGYINTEIDLGDDESISLKAPYFELAGRFGITERLDLGARLGLIGTAGLDLKYQFIGDNVSPFASSAGFGVSYVSISSSDSSGDSSNKSESNLIDLTFPVTFSYHPTDFLGLYVAPKYVMRLNNYTVNGESNSQSSGWLGATTGIRMGRKNALFVEYSYFGSGSQESAFGQFMIGLGFNIK